MLSIRSLLLSLIPIIYHAEIVIVIRAARFRGHKL